jgi:hypothetical protein
VAAAVIMRSVSCKSEACKPGFPTGTKNGEISIDKTPGL